jgi:hypothetical protein
MSKESMICEPFPTQDWKEHMKQFPPEVQSYLSMDWKREEKDKPKTKKK